MFIFHTQRAPGSAFSFAIMGDSHPERVNNQFNAELYAQTLRGAAAELPDFYMTIGDDFSVDTLAEITPTNIAADAPGFLLDLGDTFMHDKLGDPQLPEITARLRSYRSFYAQACATVPLLIVQGNHDGELGWLNDTTFDNLAVRSCLARLPWYPAPVPDGFYSCAPTADPQCGQRGGYYAWEWGEALLIVLDPYWYTDPKPKASGDNWDWTLGREQYDWLQQTLSSSQARYKLLLIHQVVGGNDTDGRGGAKAVPFYEWGGNNFDGSWGFAARRPLWPKPIHQLLLEHGVQAVFHGHDHFYAKQEVDGIVYQLVPQPGNTDLKPPVMADEYGYFSGTILPGSGHLRLTVASSGLTVQFIQSVLPANESDSLHYGQVSDSYVLH